MPYHFIGHKCQNEACGSYNTSVLSTEGMPLFSATGELLSSPASDAASTSGNSTERPLAPTPSQDGNLHPPMPVEQLLDMLSNGQADFLYDEEDDSYDDEEEEDESAGEEDEEEHTTPTDQRES